MYAGVVTPKDTHIPTEYTECLVFFRVVRTGSPPTPRPQGSVAPPPLWSKGVRHTRLEVLGGPIRTTGTDTQVLYTIILLRFLPTTFLRITQGRKDSRRYLIITRMSKRLLRPTFLYSPRYIYSEFAYQVGFHLSDDLLKNRHQCLYRTGSEPTGEYITFIYKSLTLFILSLLILYKF